MPQEMAVKDQWNILERAWIDAAALDGAWRMLSPLDTLRDAASLRLLAASSPLDEFAVHRFLITLLYWKADSVGGVAALRTKLLAGVVPAEVIAALAAERGHFDLFDPVRPFLQDPSAADPKPEKPVGSLFAEIATGTNIAHFDHSRDMKSPLCVPCVVRGLLRVVPWSQQGGAGFSPSIHGAPPIAVMPKGATLAQTLGLALVELRAPVGTPVWTGTFRPLSFSSKIPVLQALTWNPRRVHVPPPAGEGRCGLCGARGAVISGITFKSNSAVRPVKDGDDDAAPVDWRDPAFTYSEKSAKPIKSRSEEAAAIAKDVGIPLLAPEGTDTSRAFTIVVPSTDLKSKTYDHRRIEVGTVGALARLKVTHHGAEGRKLADAPFEDAAIGWRSSAVGAAVRSAIGRFVAAASGALNDADWILLGRALGRPMNEDAEAFAVFSAVYWRARSGGRSQFRRAAAWTLLKLMALVPSDRRAGALDADLAPLLDTLPTKQASRSRGEQADSEPYPVALLHGHALELALAASVEAQVARGASIPWIELGAFLHNSSR